MSGDVKEKYYSDSRISGDYDRRRFGRGGGAYVAATEEAILRRLLTAAGVHAGSVAVDCPVGTGRFIPLLQTHTRRVIAADISPPMLEIARRHGAEEYIRCSADRLPVSDASVDFWVMSRFCFHFRALEPFFAEAARVIKPGGSLAFDVFNWSPRSLCPGFLLGGRTYNHGPAVIAGLMSRHGFEIALRESAFFVPTYVAGYLPNGLVIRLERLADRFMPRAKTKSYYLARRKGPAAAGR